MKATFSGPVTCILALTLLLPAIASATVCSNANLQGTYAFVSQSVGTAALSRMGLLNADGDGNYTETFTISQEGVISENQTSSGTYSVNADCSGNIDLTLLGGTHLALLGGGDGALTTTSHLLSPVNEIGQMQRIWLGNQSLGSCSLGSFKGGFVGTQKGVAVQASFNGVDVPFENWVALISDGVGDTAEALLTGNTPGTYTVNADCTGTLSFPNGTGVNETWNFVISGNGRTIYALRTAGSGGLFAETMVVNRL